MYSDRFTLPFVAGVLMAAAERKRPALGPWSDDVRQKLREVFVTELAEVRARFFELFEDKAYWDKLEKTLLEVCFPRYCVEAEKQTALEKRDYGLWRGGDLLARATYAVGGFVTGFVMVKWDRFPIPETWDFFFILTGIAAPFIPDVQVWWRKRRYARALTQIVAAMSEAEKQLEVYQSLASSDPAPVDPLAAPSPDEPAAVPTDRPRERS